MLFDVVLSEFIHPCTKKRRRDSWRGCLCARAWDVCVRALQMCVCVCACVLQCAENFSHSARLLLQQSRLFYKLALCLRAVLISSPDTWDWTRMHAVVVMHRRTLYENVDGAFLQISIFYAWHRCIVSSYIVSIYRWIVTPLVFDRLGACVLLKDDFNLHVRVLFRALKKILIHLINFNNSSMSHLAKVRWFYWFTRENWLL